MAHDGSDGAPDPLRATSAAALGRRPRTLADGVLAGVLVSGIEVWERRAGRPGRTEGPGRVLARGPGPCP